MTKIEIIERFWREAGLPGSAPSTADSQTGEAFEMVEKADSAYIDIISSKKDWLFMNNDFILPVTSSAAEYDYSDASITDFSMWLDPDNFRIYTTSYSDEQFIQYLPWVYFKPRYFIGTARSLTGKPTLFSIKPDRSLIFYPKPDGAYNIGGEYKRAPVALATDSSEPVFPVDYHLAVVWRALMLFAAPGAEVDRYEHGKYEFQKIFSQMLVTELPEITRSNAPV